MTDIVDRLIASSCNETCLMGRAADEIKRLRKIEAAALTLVHAPAWSGVSDEDVLLEQALKEKE